MYIYRIGYGTHEESEFRQYYHKEKFSQEELENIFSECMVIAIQNRLEDLNQNVCQTTYQSLLFGYKTESIFEKELESRGFDPLKPKIQASVSVNGWEHPLNPNWTHEAYDYDLKLLKYIKNNINLDKAVCVRPFRADDIKGSCHRCPYVSPNILLKRAKRGFKYVEKKYRENDPMIGHYYEKYTYLKKYLEDNHVDVKKLLEEYNDENS